MAELNRSRAKRPVEEAASALNPGEGPKQLNLRGQEATALVALAEAAASAAVHMPDPLTEQEAAKERKRKRLHETLDRKAFTADGSPNISSYKLEQLLDGATSETLYWPADGQRMGTAAADKKRIVEDVDLVSHTIGRHTGFLSN